ncbi:CMRF35-like molecule 8 isoform X2 [Clupea harengus]|uniref:CMRF35-like molecule 8 isoform X2 n=1 Tax=Clupea harengus TaxID=7950 RepID=A0A6P8F2P9_CLUHA|nr:CMRF35-like molecule 8 isoform X2 [Clupea harengus]
MVSTLCVKVFLLCVFWTVTDGASSTAVTGRTGGSVRIRCEYDQRYDNHIKYFCKGVAPGCVDVIWTDSKQKQGRYSLLDNGVSFFLVTIAQLSDADEGVYQCAVDIPWAVDKYTEVYIKVTDGHSTISPTSHPAPSVATAPHPEASSSMPVVFPASAAPASSGPTGSAASSTGFYPVTAVRGRTGPKGSSGFVHFHQVLSAIVALLVVLMVAIIILIILLCVKRDKSADSINLPASMEATSVSP